MQNIFENHVNTTRSKFYTAQIYFVQDIVDRGWLVMYAQAML